MGALQPKSPTRGVVHPLAGASCLSVSAENSHWLQQPEARAASAGPQLGLSAHFAPGIQRSERLVFMTAMGEIPINEILSSRIRTNLEGFE